MATKHSTLIIGAGPAGLTAAYALCKAGRSDVAVLEADTKYVGGISRTEEHDGFRFDIGGHRFFSKSAEVQALWDEILPDGFLERRRSSRIYYAGRFYDYPLRATNAFMNLGPVEVARCVASYAAARARPNPAPKSLEAWVVNQFGQRLYEVFFKTYTEKVWGIPCSEISADWGPQRIKGLSLGTAMKNALAAVLPKKADAKGEVIKSLIETFRYPALGPGMMWEAATAKVRALGGTVSLDRRVRAVSWDAASRMWTVTAVDARGNTYEHHAEHLVSSAPLRELVESLTPRVDERARAAAALLRYRDFLTVVLVVRATDVFKDNWIYIHDPGVKIGRIQNFKQWSPRMVPDPALSCYGLEYFCFEGDGLWESTDAELVALGTKEMSAIGLLERRHVVRGYVVRQKKAYPVYDHGYEERVEIVRDALERDFPTLHVVGRNGMHKYNNQDHSMMTALLAAKNILAGERAYDLWRVNQDAEYAETTTSSTSGERAVPRAIRT